MVQKCKNCGEKIIKNPLWKGQERGESLSLDNIIIWNWFKIDWYSAIIFFVIVFMVISYKADIKQCEEVIERPCEFCEKSNCCQVDWGRIQPNRFIDKKMIDLDDIPDFNVSK